MNKSWNYFHYFLITRSFLLIIFVVDDVLWFFIVSWEGTCFFFPWDWLHFFFSKDFLIWIVLVMIFWFWFYLLEINYFDFIDAYLTRTDDYLIRFIASYWFWQKVLCKSFSSSIIFLSLSLSYFWKALFMTVIFSNFLWSSWILKSFYLIFS